MLSKQSSESAAKIPDVYPLARRSLIEKAKYIEPALAQGAKSGMYVFMYEICV